MLTRIFFSSFDYRCISFHPNGSCLFAASPDALRVHGWEPPEVIDSVPTSWQKVQDIAIQAQEQLVRPRFSLCCWLRSLPGLNENEMSFVFVLLCLDWSHNANDKRDRVRRGPPPSPTNWKVEQGASLSPCRPFLTKELQYGPIYGFRRVFVRFTSIVEEDKGSVRLGSLQDAM